MPFDGELQDFGLADILQMLQMGSRTGALSLRRGEEVGTLYFREGELVHATFSNLTGEKAAYQLLRWQMGRFRFDTSILPTRRSITISATNLILEAARRADEVEGLKGGMPPEKTILQLADVDTSMENIQLKPNEWKIISLIDGKRSIDQICVACSQEKVDTLQTLEKLLSHGLLQPVGAVSDSDELIDLEE